MELEDIDDRLPLAENFEPLVHATYLLTLLGDAGAGVEFAALRMHRDARVRKLAAEHVVGFWPLHRDHGPGPRDLLSEERLADLQAFLRDKSADVRGVGLEGGLREPDVRLAPQVAPILRGKAMNLLPEAARLFRWCHTHDEVTLTELRPCLEMVIPLEEIPAEASEEERKELNKKNKALAADQYDIRRYAAQALMYPHGSRATQDYLLSYFSDPTRQLKRELNVALQYCPDVDVVQAALLGMVEGLEPLRTSALFALSHFKNARHRDLFLENLQSENDETAKAALRGLQPHLESGDLAALQECRDRWKS
ncbi:hypothetical protein ABS71_09990 [bacterium SCN 62-11]|nr:MAG: hypothetical protein ABS71_09990 [bacterium SCN 62-11]